MSEQLEPCSMNDATHVEINGKVHKIGGSEVHGFWNANWSEQVGVNIILQAYDKRTIRQDLFPILGIKPMREKKPEPVVFEAVFVKHDGEWHPLYSLDDGLSYQNCKKAKFKCVEILEDEK